MKIGCVHCRAVRDKCPIHGKGSVLFSNAPIKPKQHFFGETPAPFVGRYGYPSVNVGLLNVQELPDSWKYDAPSYWSSHNYEIPQIVGLRSALIHARFNSEITAKSGKFLDIVKESAMASRPAEVEIKLDKAPSPLAYTHTFSAPTGPRGSIRKAAITSNTKISKKVERVVDDDIKAAEAIEMLYWKGFDETFLTRLLSVGNLGERPDRRLVPTRWSITATDSIIGNKIMNQVKEYPLYEPRLHIGGYLGNHFLFCFIPDVWQYELFEMYAHGTLQPKYNTDYEPYEGRKGYVEETAGGFYASRLPALEKLKSIKRQATVIALRLITKEYHTHLGVFVVREASRKALASSPLVFDSTDALVSYVKDYTMKFHKRDVSHVFDRSKALMFTQKQKRLSAY